MSFSASLFRSFLLLVLAVAIRTPVVASLPSHSSSRPPPLSDPTYVYLSPNGTSDPKNPPDATASPATDPPIPKKGDGSPSVSFASTPYQYDTSSLTMEFNQRSKKGLTEYNVGVLMASRLDSPFDLERCGPAIDLALEEVNDHFLASHGIRLKKVQASYPSCSGARAPGLAADMHYKDHVIAFIGPACAFALEPVARLAAYWNRPIITGMGDQPPSEGEVSVTSGILGRLHKWRNDSSQGIFKDKSEYPTLTRMSYCQCRLRLVFTSIFRQFGWSHVALLLDRSDLFSFTVGTPTSCNLYPQSTPIDPRNVPPLPPISHASLYKDPLVCETRRRALMREPLILYRVGVR